MAVRAVNTFLGELGVIQMIYKLIGLIVILIALGAAGTYWFVCPCETIPGGPLAGEEVAEGVMDWSFVNDVEAVPLCQIEVDFILPRSMNVNCMSSASDLFVSCSNCANKQWSARALSHPEGKIRAGGKVYPISYQRVTDSQDLDRVWLARLTKIGRDPVPRPEGWWTFNLVSR
jgi:hypothetical protein